MNRIGWFAAIASISVMAIALHDIGIESETVRTTDNDSSASMTPERSSTNGDSVVSDFNENDSSIDIQGAEGEHDALSQWMSAANKKDQSERDAADEALLKEQREKVLPALHNLILNGNTDQRQLALNALHMLALKQGDEDGEIQNMLRLTSYDGDGVIAGEAQLALEDIENTTTAIR